MGLAVGDALGTTNEFLPKGIIEAGVKPLINDIVGGGPFFLQPGQWTDDTSMALCLAMSLLEKNGFDPKDQMDKYLNWVDEGYMSSNGKCFDIGNTTAEALEKYRKTGDPYAGSTESKNSGNGSLMRLAPIPMYFWKYDSYEVMKLAADMSRTTHGSVECQWSCRYLATMLQRILLEAKKEDLIRDTDATLRTFSTFFPDEIVSIMNGDCLTKSKEQIRASGYVIHTLEAALWSFYNTDNFRDGAILAVNLCEDADTTGAVYGQLAGAYYGLSGIPSEWVAKIAFGQDILNIAAKLMI